MELTQLTNCSLEEALGENQLVIAASGYEPRSTAILRHNPRGWGATRRLVAVFGEQRESVSSLRNAAAFRSAGFAEAQFSAEDSDGMYQAVEDALAGGVSDIFIDISAMTRLLYAAAVHALVNAKMARPVRVSFCYFPGDYSRAARGVSGANSVAGPVPGFVSLEAPDRPLALVLGVGLDSGRAAGIQELLEPRRTLLCFAAAEWQPSRAVSGIRPLTGGATEGIAYPLEDPFAAFTILESCCRGLARDHRVVLASLGPKIFGLLCVLVASQHREYSVWRVSAGVSGASALVRARSQTPIVCRTVWVAE